MVYSTPTSFGELSASSYVKVPDKTGTSSYQKKEKLWKRDYIEFLH